jgi:phosphatidylinositol alpha-1,6-mannosyltransferase
MKSMKIDSLIALRTAKIFNADVIHVCTAGMAFLSISKRYPVVIRVVGNDFLRPWCGGGLLLRSLYYRVPNKKIQNYFYKKEISIRKRNISKQIAQCYRVVVNSQWTKDKLIGENVNPEKINIVIGGIDTKLFIQTDKKEKIRKELGIDQDIFLLLTAGNIVNDKGIDTVIKSIKEISKKINNIKYYIVGKGDKEEEIQKLISNLDLNDKIYMIGRKSQDELCKYYQAADIYVQISRIETMGRTFIEANACGLPVVASNVGGIPSIVKNGVNGLLVNDPEDIKEVTNKITILINDCNIRSSMGNNGYKLIKEKYSWDNVGKKIENELIEAYKSMKQK